ncbi:hypothetical protein MMC34_008588, partial [Xylographa carneopallida]|nr:hypothetical protein [Xylographa carneopallida]
EEEDEDEEEEEEDDGDEQQRRFDWETTVLEATNENLQDSHTLLTHYAFTSEQLQLLAEKHEQLAAGLARAQDDSSAGEDEVGTNWADAKKDDKRSVMEALRFFVGGDTLAAGSVSWHWRLSVEDCHSAMHQLLDWEAEDMWTEASEEMEEEVEEVEEHKPSSQLHASQARDAPQQKGEGDTAAAERAEEADFEARIAEYQKLRTHLYARMKEHGYELKPSLVKRLLREAKRHGSSLNALTLLRDTAIGRRMREADRTAEANTAASSIHATLDALILGEQPPFPAQPQQSGKRRSGELVEQRRIQAEAPLLELAIEAAADQDYTEAVRSTYPASMATALKEPPTSTAAYIAPLTADNVARQSSSSSSASLLSPSSADAPTSFTALPHLSLELYALMRQHNLPFSRASTVNALLAVCNELQLSYLAADVAHKALHDLAPPPSTSTSSRSASSFRSVARSRVAVSVLDSLLTIACNCCHVHLALSTLDRWDSTPNARPVDIASYATLLNYALHGPQHTLPIPVITAWAAGRGIHLATAGWEDKTEASGGGERQLFVLALLEAAGARGVAADDLVKEAQRAVSKELVRSMRNDMREIGRWINQQMKGWSEEAEEDDDDDGDDGDGDGHKRW